MRIIIALAFMTTPALAHPGTGLHLHEAHGVWPAAFALGVGLTLAVLLRLARAVA